MESAVRAAFIWLIMTAAVMCQEMPHFGWHNDDRPQAWAVDLDGSTEYMSKTSPSNLDLNGAEMITKWADRNFSSKDSLTWTNAGTHTIDTSSTDKRTGTLSGKLKATAAGDSTTNYVTLPATSFGAIEVGKKYTLEGWVRASGKSGSNLVNGWNLTSGWTNSNLTVVDSNTATATASNGQLFKSGFTNGAVYRIVFEGVISSGNITIRGNNGGSSLTSSGTFAISDQIPLNGTQLNIIIQTNGATLDITKLEVYLITKPTITFGFGSKWKVSDTLSVLSGQFEKIVYNFQATSAEVGQGIRVYCSQADSLYLDDWSLTVAYDMLVIGWAYFNSTTSYKTIIGNGAYGATEPGFVIYNQNGTIKCELYSNDIAKQAATFSVTTGRFYLLGLSINRTSELKSIVNSEISAGTSIVAVGKANGTTLGLASYGGTGIGNLKLNGYLGQVQIVRFNDITTESINPSAWYVQGLPSSYANGTIVFEFNPKDGSSDANMLKDYSASGNNLSGTNVTTADRVPANYPIR